MHKQLFNTLTQCLIFTPIFMLPLLISPPLKSLESDSFERKPELVAIANWQVWRACKVSLDKEEENRELSGYICRIIFDSVYEANQYHRLYVNFFKEEQMEEPLEVMEVYSITGCDINDMEYLELKHMYIDYIDHNEDQLEKSFFRTLTDVLEPYCQKIFDSSIPFYLDEDKNRRQT